MCHGRSSCNYLSAACAVEVPCRLVGQNDRGSHASARAIATRLALTSRELLGVWRRRSPSPTRSSQGIARSLRRAEPDTSDEQLACRVLDRCGPGHQVEVLEDEPDILSKYSLASFSESVVRSRPS